MKATTSNENKYLKDFESSLGSRQTCHTQDRWMSIIEEDLTYVMLYTQDINPWFIDDYAYS